MGTKPHTNTGFWVAPEEHQSELVLSPRSYSNERRIKRYLLSLVVPLRGSPILGI